MAQNGSGPRGYGHATLVAERKRNGDTAPRTGLALHQRPAIVAPPAQQLIVGLLSFFETDPAHPDAHRVRDMLGLETLQAYDRQLLREMVTSLRDSGLLYKMLHLNARAARYVTTGAGVALRGVVRQLGR